MHTSRLLSQLKTFGLNPRDWFLYLRYIKPSQPMEAVLQHRSICELKLNGQCLLREGQYSLEFESLSLKLTY